MTIELINSILPTTVLLGVIVSVAAIAYLASGKVKPSAKQALKLIDRVSKIDDDNISNVNRLNEILSMRKGNEEVFRRENVQEKIQEILSSMNESSIELIDIMKALGTTFPPPLSYRVIPRTQEIEQKISATKIKVNELITSLGREQDH